MIAKMGNYISLKQLYYTPLAIGNYLYLEETIFIMCYSNKISKLGNIFFNHMI